MYLVSFRSFLVYPHRRKADACICAHPFSLSLSRAPACAQKQVKVSKGSHASEAQVNKQLQDKERVAAALENGNLLEKVELTLSGKTAM